MVSNTDDGQEDSTSKQRLAIGIKALTDALENCILNPDDKKSLKRLIVVKKQALARVERTPVAPPQPSASLKSSDPALEDSTRCAVKKKAKKSGTEKLEKLVKLANRQRREEIAETNKKSGLSSFLVRLPGSFESGRKR